MSPRLRRSAFVLLGFAAFVAACEKSATGPAGYLDVQPDTVRLYRLQTWQLSATVLDGDSALVTNASVSFASADTSVAKVTPSGLLTAVAPGTTTVTGRHGSLTDACVVVVLAAVPARVLLQPDTLSLAVGGTAFTTVMVLDADGLQLSGAPVTYASRDTSVAAVSNAGTISARGSGITWIVASAGAVGDSLRLSVHHLFAGGLLSPIGVTGDPWALALTASQLLVAEAGAGKLLPVTYPGLVVGTGIPVGATTVDVIASADGRYAWTANSGDDAVARVNLGTGAVTTAAVGETPWRLLLTPDGSKLLVTTTSGIVHVLDATTLAALSTIAATSGAANGITLSPDRTRIYIAAFLGGQVAELDASTLAVLRQATVGPNLQEIVPSPDGRLLYVASEAGPIRMLSTASLAVVDSIPVSGVFGLCVSRDGVWLVATSARSGSVAVIDRVARSVSAVFTLSGPARRIVEDATGTFFIANTGGFVERLK